MRKSTARKKFQNEGLLQQAIAGLLERMPEIEGVQILHGAQEYGKDIVFRGPGPIGERITCACVVKNSKLTGDVSKAIGARTVFLQIEQAFDTPFLNESGGEENVSCVYVMTPYAIGQETMRAISGKLKAGPKIVRFIHSTELFALFERYWPDFLAEESNEEGGQLLQHAANDLSKDTALEKVAARYHLATEGPIQLERTYVDPSFHVDLLRFQRGVWELLFPTVLDFQIPSHKMWNLVKALFLNAA
jgi:hypothetical protein